MIEDEYDTILQVTKLTGVFREICVNWMVTV
jgi:hypothetical protein